MTDDEINDLVLAFLDERGGYVASASERELCAMVKTAVEQVTAERDRVKVALSEAIAECERWRALAPLLADIVRYLRAAACDIPAYVTYRGDLNRLVREYDRWTARR